jgi:MoxR-like ATPase
MRLSVGYPDAAAERAMLAAEDRRELLAELKPCLDAARLIHLQQQVRTITASAALVDYVQRLLVASRNHAGVRVGLSPRAGLALLAAARANAFLAARGHVLPADVQSVFAAVAAHRLVPSADLARSRDALTADLLRQVRVD